MIRQVSPEMMAAVKARMKAGATMEQASKPVRSQCPTCHIDHITIGTALTFWCCGSDWNAWENRV